MTIVSVTPAKAGAHRPAYPMVSDMRNGGCRNEPGMTKRANGCARVAA